MLKVEYDKDQDNENILVNSMPIIDYVTPPIQDETSDDNEEK